MTTPLASGWTLHHGDCIAGGFGHPRSECFAAFDVVITDAPYSDHVHAKVRRGGSVHAPDRTDGGPKRPVISTSQVLGFDALDADTRHQCARWFAHAQRWVLAFSDVESAHEWRASLEAAGLEYVRTMFWVKLGATPQFTGDRPASQVEAITVAHRPGRKRWNGGGRGNVYSFAIESSADRFHTTQKPLALMEALVRDFTDPGETILDPFAGSGTTGVAAIRLGRSFVGWEQDAKYHALATKRLEGTREQLALPERGQKPKQLALAGGTP